MVSFNRVIIVTIQPFREEINRIINTYISNGAPRQLNLSDRDRKMVLHALSYTTHPSALRVAVKSVEYVLRMQSHPNFVRWSTGNGCPARINFSRTLGWIGIFGGFIAAILATLSTTGRGWRAFALLGWVPGIHAVVASHRGMCICMYIFSRHRYHIRPWELFQDEENGGGNQSKESFDSFGSSNSFEMEPWIQKYHERNVWRKIFDREAPIEQPIIRLIQNTIFVQTCFIGLAAGLVLAGMFLALPAGNFF